MKKAKKDLEVVLDELGLNTEVKEEVISLLTLSFGNEDLNLLRDKINEIITRG